MKLTDAAFWCFRVHIWAHEWYIVVNCNTTAHHTHCTKNTKSSTVIVRLISASLYIKIFFHNIWNPGFDKRKPIPPNWEKAWACYVHYVCYYTIEILIIWISCIQNTWIYCSTRGSIAASRAKPECCNTVPSAAINPSILNKWNSNYKYLYFVSFY